MVDVVTELAGLKLRNPVIVGSCELTTSEKAIMACIEAGAGAVVAKSVNERPEAVDQLARAAYVLLGQDFGLVDWGRWSGEESLLCRSGLVGVELEAWIEMLSRCDEMARRVGSVVIGSVTVSSQDAAAEIAGAISQKLRCVEVNLSAPHGREAAAGQVRLVTEPEGVREFTTAVREAVSCALIVKITGQSNDVTALAVAAVEAGADAVAMIGRFPGFLPKLDSFGAVIGSWGAIGGRWALPITCYWVGKSFLALGGRGDIIGTNGIRDGRDVVRLVLSGANAVEVASVVLAEGPRGITRIVSELCEFLEKKGVLDIKYILGLSIGSVKGYDEFEVVKEAAPWERFLR